MGDLQKLVSSNQEVSSKRVVGIACITYSMLMSTASIVFKLQLDEFQVEMVKAFLYTGAVLLTGGVLDGMFNKR